MSLAILGLDKTGTDLYVVTDKRTVKEIDFSFVSDNNYKIHHLREDLVYFGSSYTRVQDAIIPLTNQIKNLPATKIIQRIKEWDRRFITLDGKIKRLGVQLAGVYDDGRLFIAAFQEDGNIDMHFAVKGQLNGTIHSPDDEVTQSGMKYLPTVVKSGLFNGMVETAHYLASIDSKISPDLDFYHISISEINKSSLIN